MLNIKYDYIDWTPEACLIYIFPKSRLSLMKQTLHVLLHAWILTSQSFIKACCRCFFVLFHTLNGQWHDGTIRFLIRVNMAVTHEEDSGCRIGVSSCLFSSVKIMCPPNIYLWKKSASWVQEATDIYFLPLYYFSFLWSGHIDCCPSEHSTISPSWKQSGKRWCNMNNRATQGIADVEYMGTYTY